jgi:hypothetical protein
MGSNARAPGTGPRTAAAGNPGMPDGYRSLEETAGGYT